MKVED